MERLRVLVVIARELPPQVRGRMKLWFVEPRPNVFVSGVKDHLALEIVDYLFGHCPERSGLLIFRSTRQPPGYVIRGMGDLRQRMTEISGMQLVFERNIPIMPDEFDDSQPLPF